MDILGIRGWVEVVGSREPWTEKMLEGRGEKMGIGVRVKANMTPHTDKTMKTVCMILGRG